MSSIRLKHASGNSMSLAAPGTNPASNLELKLPHTIGSANQLLKVDGNGQLEWAGEVQLFHNGNLSAATASDDFDVYRRLRLFAARDMSGHQLSIGQWDGSNHRIEGDANRPIFITAYNSSGIKFGYQSGEKVQIDNSGLKIVGGGILDFYGSRTTYRHTGSYGEFKNNTGDLYCAAAGNLLFYTDTSFNAERMRIASNGNVGIGNRTGSPSSLLHIHTSSGDAVAKVEGASDAWLSLISHAGDSQVRFGDAGSGAAGQIRFDHGTNHLFFEIGGSQRGKIASDGSTTWGPSSAGTSNMQWTKDTNQIPHFFWGQGGGAQPADGAVVIGNPQADICSQRVGTLLFGSATTGGSGNTGLKAGMQCYTTGSPGSDFNAGGDLRFLTKASNSSLNEKMRLDPNGNFMIGRTSGSKKFSVREGSSSSGTHLVQTVGGNNHVAGYAVGIGFDPEGYSARNKIAIVAEGIGAGYSRGKLHFLLDSANDSGEATLSESRMSISESGMVLIQATSSSSSDAANKGFTFTSHSSSPYLRVKHSGSSSGYAGHTLLHLVGGTSMIGEIKQDGDGTVTYATSSDYRLKENIVDLTGAITRLKNLKPKRFNFKANSGLTKDGFLAHELQEVVPESVNGTKDEVVTVDSKANIPTLEDLEVGDPVYQTADASRIVPLITAALQEAISKIETLETKVAALEAG